MVGMSCVLAIDAAAPEVGVALVSDASVLFEWRERLQRGTDAALLPAIQEALAVLGDMPLRGVALTVGPGTFTGLRVGMAAALGVAVARDVPVFPDGSLDARARVFGHEPVLVLLDARKSRFYGQWFHGGAPTSAPVDADLDTLLCAGAPCHATGEGAVVARERLVQAGFDVSDTSSASPVVALAQAALAGLLPPVDAALVTLRYVRPPDATPPAHVLRPVLA